MFFFWLCNRQVVDYNEEQCLRRREIAEEVEEERELFELELSEREVVYQTKLAQWMRIRNGGREGGREGGGEGGGERDGIDGERQEENNTEQQSGMETASQPSLRPMSPSSEGYHENCMSKQFLQTIIKIFFIFQSPGRPPRLPLIKTNITRS